MLSDPHSASEGGGLHPSTRPSIHPSIQSSGLSFDLWSPGSGPAVWTTALSLPFLGVPSCPIVYPPGTVKTSSSTSSATDQEPQLHSCSLPFKNRLGYQPGQLRDLHASWGLRNFSALPRSFISVWILWVIVCVCMCVSVYVYIFACVCEDRPVLQAKREDLLSRWESGLSWRWAFRQGGFSPPRMVSAPQSSSCSTMVSPAWRLRLCFCPLRFFSHCYGFTFKCLFFFFYFCFFSSLK